MNLNILGQVARLNSKIIFFLYMPICLWLYITHQSKVLEVDWSLADRNKKATWYFIILFLILFSDVFAFICDFRWQNILVSKKNHCNQALQCCLMLVKMASAVSVHRPRIIVPRGRGCHYDASLLSVCKKVGAHLWPSS